VGVKGEKVKVCCGLRKMWEIKITIMPNAVTYIAGREEIIPEKTKATKLSLW
jgi:hypothetical protein